MNAAHSRLTLVSTLVASLGLFMALAMGSAEAGGKRKSKSPKMPEKTERAWPSAEVEWETAIAYTYNFVPFGPGHKLFVYRDGEWNANIESKHELTREQAEKALALTHQTRGGVRVSKCAFPRHAVVFMDADANPIGSVNVCFECGDILVWPPYFGDDEDEGGKYSTVDGESLLVMRVWEQVMPEWEALFRDELKVLLEPPKDGSK